MSLLIAIIEAELAGFMALGVPFSFIFTLTAGEEGEGKLFVFFGTLTFGLMFGSLGLSYLLWTHLPR